MTSLLKNKTKTLRYIILLFIVSALGACDKQTVYHAFQSIPQEGWKRQDTLLFNVAVPDSQTYYNLTVETRNRSTYPYQNINLSICYDSPELKKLQTDTLAAVLADKEGIWKGDGWGGLYQSAFPAGSIKIGKPGDYLFKVAYTLPDSILPGINDVGIKLQR
ncbi:gliding motility lipoprotein GldH [Bacteroides stercoris]|jgi:gliding motility-associated lipoprotein GldH|uniref:Gliding motility lipoprotein GldH n=1 Tax=Bacteroides stercoris TaxID=46506 RepID=A0A414KU13_BACSE|nr:gliding motility lipoprotein GldH [Bacteroides stercoris]KAB5260074.1 gliding motility lipoprotein GldH [Bacteroides stercoris]KAB5262022.1 gliding motility lipoprotein GldH [Bacteroides stercoris]KAB5279733.1 gliding motility lipoprotein GldH [Bacteroides stercoris]KAB5280193.1 gliding motility lipoprotein GldH [Bacteroides stercoris]KAB5284698.1 gliding motility lipoprotein GldH [Bacteroides stercoris]